MGAQSKSGGNTISGTAGNDHLNGGAGADDLRGLGGHDRINGGSGDDVLDGGAGNDIVSGDAGDDLLIYGMGENAGSTDIYDGGSGRDTLQLEMTRAEWQSPAVQADIARYLAFLAEVTNPVNGQANNRNFTFSSGLTVSKFENLSVIVDGVALDPRDEAVTLADDGMSAGEDTASIAVDVLANDSVPDLIASLTNTQPAHGAVVLTRTSGAPGAPDTASFVYTPDAGHWQYLAEGETATDTFTYTVTDSDGDVRTATVTVTITGSNDAPTLGAVVSQGAVVEDAGAGVTGVIAFADVDILDSHSVASAANGDGYLGVFSAVLADDSTGDGEGSVAWSFSIDDAAIQHLAAGETLTQSYTVTVSDGHGGTVEQVVEVTITGTNDAPVISGADGTGSVTETEVAGVPASATPVLLDAGFNDTFAAAQVIDRADLRVAANGNLADATDPSIEIRGSIATRDDQDVYRIDLKAGETLTLDIDFAGIIRGVGGLDSFIFLYDAAGNLLNFNDDSSTMAGGGGSTSTQDSFLQFVASLDGTFYIVVKDFDQFGQSSAGSYSLNVSVDSQNLQLTDAGSMTFADVDLADGHTVSVAAQDAGYLGALTAVVADDSTNDGVGTVNWTFSVANAAVQFLAAGETRTQTYTVTVDDGQGGTASETVTVTITGENDGPVISTAFSSGQVTENGALSAGGVIAFDDVDLIDAHSVASAAEATGYLGTFNAVISAPATGEGAGEVTWTFTATDAELAFLSEGQSLLQRYIVTLDDGNGGTTQQLVNVTIVGTNDAPTVASSTSYVFSFSDYHDSTVYDGTNASFQEHGFDFDGFYDHAYGYGADSGGMGYTHGNWNWSVGGSDGTISRQDGANFSIESFSVANFSSDSTATIFGYVNGVLVATQTFSVNSQHQTVTLDPAFRNVDEVRFEAPQDDYLFLDEIVIGSIATVQLTELTDADAGEGSATLSASGGVAFSDVDLNDTHTATVAAQGSGYVGGLILNGVDQATNTVNWTFSANDAELEHLAEGETITQSYVITIDDGHGGTVDQVIDVAITGTNDGPVAMGDSAGTDEDTAIVLTAASLLANDSDVDGGAPTLTSVSGVSANGASVSINAAGDVVYDPSTSSNLQGLSRGQQATDTFTYTVTDAHGATSTATVTITVEGSLEAPVAQPDTVVVSEGGSASGNVVANDAVTGSTADSGNVLVNGSFEDGHGIGAGGIGYPASLPGWTSVQGSFEVWGTGFQGNTASDGTAFLELDNGGGRDAYSSNLTTDAGREYTLAFDLAQRNGTWPSSNQVEFFVNGVSLGIFTPPSTTFSTFTVTFIGSGSDVITFREPAGANDGVGGLIDNLRIAADADVFVTAVDGDSALVGAEVEGSNGGEFIVQSDGSYTFEAGDDFDHLGVGESATTSVTYTVTDDGGSSSTTLSVTVQGENDGPVANADAIAAVEDQAVTFDVRSNDSDLDGDTLTVTHINGQAIGVGGTVALDDGGFLRLNPNGALTYTPAANASGQVDFTYTVADGFGGVATASATIDVAGVADAPVLAVGSSTVLNPTVGSAIRTTLSLEAGDVVSFTWDFVAHDYMPYNDFAFASVNGAAYMLGSVQVVGDYGTTGWKTFTFTATEAGEYSFGVGVSNVNDSSLNSHLLVDNLQVNGVTVSSFEGGLSGWTTLGSVGVQGGHDGVVPTHGAQMAYLDSASQSASAIEAFLGLVPGRLARIAEAAGQQGDEVTVPVSMTLGAGEAMEDSYVVITGFPEGSTFNFGEADAGGGWRVPASDLGGNLLINTPDDYFGSFTLTVVATTFLDETGSSASTAPQSITVTIDPAPGAMAPEAAPLAMSSKSGPEYFPVSDDDAFVMPPVDDLGPLVLPDEVTAKLELLDLPDFEGSMVGAMFLTVDIDGQISFGDDPFASRSNDGDIWG